MLESKSHNSMRSLPAIAECAAVHRHVFALTNRARIAALAAVMALTTASRGVAATYVVDQNNSVASDSNNGTAAAPLKTIDAALNRVQPGDRVWVRGSTDPNSERAIYDRTLKAGLPIKTPGQFGAPIRISAAKGHTVILQGSGSRNGIELDNASYYVISGFTFRNYQKAAEGYGPKTNIAIQDCEFSQMEENGLRLKYLTNFVMRNCYVHHCYECGISLRESSNAFFYHCTSSYNDDGKGVDGDGDGFHTLNCKDVTFVNCIARGNSEDGFDLTADAKMINCISSDHPACNVKLWRRIEENYTPHRFELTNCLIYGAGECGIKASRGAEAHITNCIIHNSGETGIKFNDPNYGLTAGTISGIVQSDITNCIISLSGYSGVEVAGAYMNVVAGRNNQYYRNALASVGFSSTVNDIYADPLFVDPDSGNFQLQPGSPALNTGDSFNLPADDLDLDHDGDTTEPVSVDVNGNPRILSGEVDRGASE